MTTTTAATTTTARHININVPYVTTIVVDYLLLLSIIVVAYVLAADDRCTAPTAGLATLYLPFLNTTREQLYWWLFRSRTGDLAQIKTSWRMTAHPEWYGDVLKTTALVVLGVAAMAHWDMVHCRIIWAATADDVEDDVEDYSDDGERYGSSSNSALLISMFVICRDYWTINLLKDNITMRYIHPWMHKRENYWMHKRHHAIRRSTNLWGSFFFDPLDLFVEFQIGGALALLFNAVVFGGRPSVHLLSLLFSIWTDANVHSENPYSQCIGNPVLDWYLKPNICHNLHHAFENDPRYMVVWPFHHFRRRGLEADVAKYNRAMKTEVNFRIFL